MLIKLSEVFSDDYTEVLEYFKSILTSKGKLFETNHKKAIKKNNKIALILEDIKKQYDISLHSIYFALKHSIDEIPLNCPVCGEKINHGKIIKNTCGKSKCAAHNPERLEKTRKTCLEKYGTEYSWQSNIVKAKIKKTLSQRYGVDCAWKADEVKDKIKTTLIKNHGVSSPMKSEKIREKAKQTMLDKYGVTHQMYLDSTKEKIRKTCQERYGVDNVFQDEDVKEKIKGTLLERYGAEYVTQVKELKEKIRQVCLDKYGVEYNLQDKNIRAQCRDTFCINYRSERYPYFAQTLVNNNISMLTSYTDHLTAELIHFRCDKCGKEFDRAYSTDKHRIKCPYCNVDDSMEAEVYKYLRELLGNEEIQRHNRSILKNHKELDIYIPNKHLAIEFDGLYWHSSDKHDKYYHLQKTLECKEKGIHLIHILENEWLCKKEIVKSIIKAKLGIYDTIIYGRNCAIKTLTNSEYYSFLDANHIQGKIPASEKLGLIYNGEIVSCLGISKSRFKKGEMEVIRFCNKINTRVIGSLTKLLKHSKTKALISYIDLRYFDGFGYEKAGFSFVERTGPSYIYASVKNGDTLSRYQCQKHKLKKLLGDIFEPALSEEDNMILSGYYKIYDCGNIKLAWALDKFNNKSKTEEHDRVKRQA